MKNRIIICLALIFSFFFLNSQAQNNYRNLFSYLSPKPGAEYIMPEQKVSFRLLGQIDNININDIKFDIAGSKSDRISGTLALASDKLTYIFSPSKSFALNEKVNVVIQFPSNLNLPEYAFCFYTSSISEMKKLMALETIYENEFGEFETQEPKSKIDDHPSKVYNDSLPEGFPEITTTHWNNPSPGYYYVSPLAYALGHYYLIMLDNYQTPVFYRKIPPNGSTDFKLQPNGQLSYFGMDIWKYYIMNPQFEVVDTIGAGNGYSTDLHELRLFENGHAFLLSYDPQIVDMSLVVPGGQVDAVVTGLIVQELDENENVIFQWRSWDHFQITDASNWIDLTDPTIDYVHGNSIEIESETEMLISCRNMYEITKLNRQTGDIIWRLNGENNMFTFVNWPEKFCGQHSIRLMQDSVNYSLFDNGGCHNPEISSAMEFAIDEENMTASLLSQYRSEPDIFGSYMANTQRMINGNTINGWGSGIPSVTEFDSIGNILLEYSFPYLNYRAFKYNWKHTIFSVDADEIEFGNLLIPDSSYRNITITNKFSSEILINRVLNHDDIFSITNDLPILLPAGGTAEVQLIFMPDTIGVFDDVMTFCWDINSDTLVQRIACQVKLRGSANGYEGVDEFQDAGFCVYPSPFKDFIIIESNGEIIDEVIVYNMDGKEVLRKEDIQSRTINYKLGLNSGVYILQIKMEDEKHYSGKIIRE